MNIKIRNGLECALKLCCEYKINSLLDIGSGFTDHELLFSCFIENVYTNEFDGVCESKNYPGDFLNIKFDRKFDVVYASDVLEHQRNIGQFIEKMSSIATEDGYLAIIVPKAHLHKILSGHISSWNVGFLLYNIVVSGIDCRNAIVSNGQYEISIIVPNKKILPSREILQSGVIGNISKIRQYFPVHVEHGIDANMSSINWNDNYILPNHCTEDDFEIEWANSVVNISKKNPLKLKNV